MDKITGDELTDIAINEFRERLNKFVSDVLTAQAFTSDGQRLGFLVTAFVLHLSNTFLLASIGSDNEQDALKLLIKNATEQLEFITSRGLKEYNEKKANSNH